LPSGFANRREGRLSRKALVEIVAGSDQEFSP
jgi:hypothetical protein